MDKAPPRPIRILHVTFSLDAGGMENGIVNVCRGLAGAEFEAHVCCLARGGAFVERFPDPARVHVLGKPEGFSLEAVRRLSREIREVAPDVIHTHNLGPLIYTALAAPRGACILHGEHAELSPSELAPHRMMLRRLLYARAARVHTVSAGLRESLVRHGFPGGKIETIVNGVDTARFAPGPREAARAQTGLPREAFLAGLVGRFGAFKRHEAVIEAFEAIAGKHPALELVFVGAGGPLEPRVRERAAGSAFAGRIHLAGLQRELGPWYQSLNLLLVPSVNEGLSNALLEGMACGIPALANTACGNGDVIRDGVDGFVRDLGTPVRLSMALEEVLARGEGLEAMGQAARAEIESRFSLGSMVEAYAALYRRMLAAAAGRKMRERKLTEGWIPLG